MLKFDCIGSFTKRLHIPISSLILKFYKFHIYSSVILKKVIRLHHK